MRNLLLVLLASCSTTNVINELPAASQDSGSEDGRADVFKGPEQDSGIEDGGAEDVSDVYDAADAHADAKSKDAGGDVVCPVLPKPTHTSDNCRITNIACPCPGRAAYVCYPTDGGQDPDFNAQPTESFNKCEISNGLACCEPNPCSRYSSNDSLCSSGKRAWNCTIPPSECTSTGAAGLYCCSF